MNPRHSNFSTLITATVFAVALSLLHVPSVFAGFGSAGPGVVSVGAGMVSRDAKMAQIRREYHQEVIQIWLDEAGVVSSNILAATNPPLYILNWSISTTLRVTGVVPEEKSVLLRTVAPHIPLYDLVYTLFAPRKVE